MSASRHAVADLSPGAFGLVMATGIVSIAAHFAGLAPVAWALFAVTLAAYAVLCVLTALRVVRHPARVLGDLTDHQRGVGFFTIVAATSVLGRQFEFLTGATAIPVALWFLALALWVALLYAFLTAVIVREPKPDLGAGLNGAWLMLVVATQSISILGALVADHFTGSRPLVLFFMLATYLLGGMLYVLLIPLLFHRLAFFPLAPAALTPPYWINMGALAITTLAGATLIHKAPESPLLHTLTPFLIGLTLLFWVTGTWWIPLLAVLGVWRHAVRRVPIAYDVQYWSLVFPLGMYAAATFQLAEVTGLEFLAVIPRAFVWIALAAWSLAFVGLLRRLVARGMVAPFVAVPAAGVPSPGAPWP